MTTQPQTVGPQSKTFTGLLFSSFLAWCLIALLTVSAIRALTPPKPVAATAPKSEFSAERAMAHVGTIARVPHPIGSAADDAVKEYLIAQLSGLGLNPQIFPAIGIYQGTRDIVIGDTRDVIGRLPGTASSRAMVLMAHYDSVYRAAGAADDGAAVAAILETVRALRNGPALKNDLIVLFTDGEEAGLLGAEAFVSSHPWMKDVGLILNFEARGNNGVSLLFETSPNNRSVIEAVAKAAPDPTASSLFYALYKLLPNDTDFTVFRSRGTPGLNFAFGENLEAYHSRLDTKGNLSTASLQHHGSYALSLARQFGQMDLARLGTLTGDDIFFDWFGGNLVVYGQSWVVPGEIAATMLLILAIGLSVRNAEVRVRRILLALLPSVAILLLVPAVLFAAGWLVLRLLAGHLIFGDSPANSWLLAGMVSLGAFAGGLLFVGFSKRFTVQELSFAGLIIVCTISWAVALLLPAGSYMLFWPLFLMALGLVTIEVLDMGASTRAQCLATVAGSAATILLFAPIVYLLYIFLTLQLLTIVAVGLLIGLFLIICIPLLNIALPPEKWKFGVVLLFVGSVLCIVTGAKQSHSSARYPWQDSIVYSLDADHQTAVWLSYDVSPDAWTSQFIPDALQHPQPNYLAGWREPVLSSPASALQLAPPIADVRANEIVDNLRKIQMSVRSPRNATWIDLRFDKDVRPIAIKIAGRELVPLQKSQGLTISLFGPFPNGADLELTFKSQSSVAFWLMDHSYGLPEVGARVRPENIMASEGSDQTMVCRKYQL
jgi:peptidase M28-like protein